MNDCSENEDDPYASSGEDWKAEEEKKKKVTRRLSTRLSKKPRISLMDMDEFSSDEDENHAAKMKRLNGKPKVIVPKKPIVAKPIIIKPIPPKPVAIVNNIASSTAFIAPPDFASGSFVINKCDAENFNFVTPPNIWRIDGKALLQKYEPYNEESTVKYKNTSVYTGWSAAENYNYVPIKNVNIHQTSAQSITVTFDLDQFKELIILDSEFGL